MTETSGVMFGFGEDGVLNRIIEHQGTKKQRVVRVKDVLSDAQEEDWTKIIKKKEE